MKKININKNNLKIDAPQLCLEWNYSKNTSNPEDYVKNSHYKVWWVCAKEHEWEAAISSRSKNNGTGCPYCSNKKACKDNCLDAIHPEISLEWNYEKNKLTPKDVLPNTKQKVWWKCNKGHEWKAWISDRTHGTKCTECAYGYIVRERKEIYSIDGYQKLCKNCEKWFDLSEFRLKGNNKKGHWEDNVCKKCSSQKIKDYRLTDKGIAATIITRTKYTSKKEGYDFDLDKDWVLDRLNSIKWRCELSGLPFNIIRDNLEHKKDGFQWDALSIDKIVPHLGYVKNNVRFILNQLNVFKQDGTDDRMFMLSELILKNKGKNEK